MENRVRKIRENVENSSWRHIPGELDAADMQHVNVGLKCYHSYGFMLLNL